MADITFDVAAASWNVNGSWVGGAKPGVTDNAIITSTSGNVTIDSGSVAKSADFNTYTGTLTSAAQTLTLGDTGGGTGTGNRILRMVAGMTVTDTPVFN